MVVTSDMIAGAAGILLSLAFSYIPKFKDWFSALTDTQQRGLFGFALILVAIGSFSLACVHLTGLPFLLECSSTGAVGLGMALVSAFVTSQTTHHFTG